MDILTKLKNDSVEARKNRDAELSAVLTTLLSDCMMVGKNKGNRLPTSEECIKVFQKAKKTAQENFELTSLPKFESEIKIISAYLPEELSRTDIRMLISDFMFEYEKLPAMKMNVQAYIMKSMNEKHAGQFDPKNVSQLIREHTMEH